MQLEAASFKRNNAGIEETSSAKMSLKEFDLMIDNFLVNERNQMRKDYFMKTISQTTKFLKNSNISPGVLPAPPGTVFVECIGTVTGQNSINTILFLAGVYNNYAYHPTFSFGGFSGTMAPTGNFIQSRSQGVVTYRQFYTETIHQSNGGTYTWIYVIYGNIYNGQATTHGMRVTN